MYTSSQLWQLLTHEASAACRKSSSYATPSSTTPCLKTSRLFESKENHTVNNIPWDLSMSKRQAVFWHMMCLCRVMLQIAVSSDMCTSTQVAWTARNARWCVQATFGLATDNFRRKLVSVSYPFWLDIFCIFSNSRLHFYHPCRLPIKASKII